LPFSFLATLVATLLAVTYLGHAGVRILAAIMGVTDVDPFIMGMTQASAPPDSCRRSGCDAVLFVVIPTLSGAEGEEPAVLSSIPGVG
jgi:hypothetical protein